MSSNPYRVHTLDDYEVWVLEGANGIDRRNDNVDVEVNFKTGERYGATIYTLENVASLMQQWRTTGDCRNGLYFAAPHVILVSELTSETILALIADLYKDGTLARVMERLSDS